jgi:hypothetical protein
MKRTVMMIIFVLVLLLLASPLEGLAGGQFHGREVSVNMGWFYNYWLISQGIVYSNVYINVPDKEVLSGWHTTSIGASFCGKEKSERQEINPK